MSPLHSEKEEKNAVVARSHRARQYIRFAVATVLRYLGIFRLERAVLGRRAGFVLAFHQVIQDAKMTILPDARMYVTTSVFRDLLLFLQKRYDVVPLTELLTSFKSKECRQRPPCALTFDDGYMDNYFNAFPVLRQFSVPATIFLTAGLVDSKQLLWTDTISIALSSLSEHWPTVRNSRQLLPSDRVSLPLFSDWPEAAPTFSARTIVERLKTRPRASIDTLLSVVRACPSFDERKEEPFRLLTWNQVREMMRDGLQFGAHSLTHAILTLESDETVCQEIMGSKNLIESEIHGAINAIAYPNGAYSSKTIQIARTAGFEVGLTLEKELVTRHSDPMRLGRFIVNQKDLAFRRGRFSSQLFEYEKSVLVASVKRWFLRRCSGRSERMAR